MSLEQSTSAVNAVLGIISNETSKRNSISIPDFGKFETKVYPPKKGINPKTRESIDIPERQRVTFKPFENFSRFCFKYLPSVPE
jgi:nucleoid DNA-binding protein